MFVPVATVFPLKSPAVKHQLTRCCWAAVAAVAASAAAAQYVYNPANADEGPGVRFFGSAKNDDGALLPGVSILLENGQLSVLIATNDQGRYRVDLPVDTQPERVTAKCFKTGMQFVRMVRRSAPKGPKVMVQLDCVLRAASTG